jgi:hypothetical protein
MQQYQHTELDLESRASGPELFDDTALRSRLARLESLCDLQERKMRLMESQLSDLRQWLAKNRDR